MACRDIDNWSYMSHSTLLTTYRTACVVLVFHEPRSLPRYELPADSLIQCRATAIPGWVEWLKAGHSQGYIHLGDLDEVPAQREVGG